MVPTEGQRGPVRRRNGDVMPFDLGIHSQGFFFFLLQFLFYLLLRVNDMI